jgi:DHA1 family bicyclomycin/chloramphenicol resistance-like MFS transporter
MTTDKRRDFFIILMLGALSTITPFAVDMYLPAFPQIAADMHSSAAKVSLSLSSYFIGFAFGQIVYGPLLDRYGRKKPLYAGLAIFIAASVGCIYSESVNQLIVFRLLQALGGCAAPVAAMAMVRDFFPIEESARIFSLLVLILGVSPLFAPTVGSFVAVHYGWHAVFIILIAVVAVILAVVCCFLPESHRPDHSVSLKPLPILRNFALILKQPQFFTYAFSGAFSFAGLLVYVAGSPVIFMHGFHTSAQMYGGIFALLSVGFIGGNQVNILLLRRFKSERIYRAAMLVQVITSVVFLIGVIAGGFGLAGTIALFFILLSCLGLTYPNGAALALAPFHTNIGSASALMGSLQIGVAAFASSCIGLFNAQTILPVIAVLSATTAIGYLIMLAGERAIGNIAEPEPVLTSIH